MEHPVVGAAERLDRQQAAGSVGQPAFQQADVGLLSGLDDAEPVVAGGQFGDQPVGDGVRSMAGEVVARIRRRCFGLVEGAAGRIRFDRVEFDDGTTRLTLADQSGGGGSSVAAATRRRRRVEEVVQVVIGAVGTLGTIAAVGTAGIGVDAKAWHWRISW
jgi:hypothetical protein